VGQRRPGSGPGGITRAVEGGRLGDGPFTLAAREERRRLDGAARCTQSRMYMMLVDITPIHPVAGRAGAGRAGAER
jgi:hypothetical protein